VGSNKDEEKMTAIISLDTSKSNQIKSNQSKANRIESNQIKSKQINQPINQINQIRSSK